MESEDKGETAGRSVVALRVSVTDSVQFGQTLTAIEHHKVQLASRALACWRAWTPGRDMSLQAAETDRRAMQSELFRMF